MNEGLSYKGSLLPNTERGVTAVFNGPFVSGPNKETFILPREMKTPQVAGMTDCTSSIGVYTVDPVGGVATHHHSLSTETIRGAQTEFHPEDLRVFQESADALVFFGLTAATRIGSPHPACFSAHYPFTESTVSQMRIMNDLKPGKNVLPLSWDVGVYREEGKEQDQSLTFFQWYGDGSVIRRISLPPCSWVGKEGRYGLTGGTRIEIGGGKTRMLIHGLRRRDGGYVEYALGLADCRFQDDGTFEVLAVDQEPLITYAQIATYMDELGITTPDPGKFVIYAVDARLLSIGLFIPITFKDRAIGFFEVGMERLHRPLKKV